MPVQFDLPSASYRRILIDPVVPATKVGVLTGGAGFIGGGFFGILRSSPHPILLSALSGVQCFGLGTSFWYFRSALIEARFDGRPTTQQALLYSTIAGSISGGLNGALRSRSNVIPGAIVMGLFSFVGQGGYNMAVARQAGPVDERSLMQRVMDSKWMPMKAISDADYEKMLLEKILKVDVEIALIDEKIESLQNSKRQNELFTPEEKSEPARRPSL